MVDDAPVEPTRASVVQRNAVERHRDAAPAWGLEVGGSGGPLALHLGPLTLGLGPSAHTNREAALAFDLLALVGRVLEAAERAPMAQASPAKARRQESGASESARGDLPTGPGKAPTSAQGSFDAGLVRGEGQARAGTYAGTFSSGSAGVGLEGANAAGELGASVGASAEAEGTLESDLGSAHGHVKISAEARARLAGRAHADLKGVTADGVAEAGALATAQADGGVSLLGGLASADARGIAEAGTGASATAHAVATFAPPQAAVTGTAGAFAGARAGFEASAGGLGAREKIAAEAWAGVGAKAEFHGGLENGKFTFGFGLGAAVGVGAFLSMEYEVDVSSPGAAAKSIMGLGASLLGSGLDMVLGKVGLDHGEASGVLNGIMAGLFGDTPQAKPGAPTKRKETHAAGDGLSADQQRSRSLSDRMLSNVTTTEGTKS